VTDTVAITGGYVLPMSSEPIEGGTVRLRDGRIEVVDLKVKIPVARR